jgi:hypothetical protein
MARQWQHLDPPTPVELLAPLWLADEDRPIHQPGDRVELPADVAEALIDAGFARATE